MPIAYESGKLKSWASNCEVDTLLQAERTARLPFVHDHLALMPDAHVGKGATVGSVIPTKNAIIPAAAGVDLGCVDRDSEYLSPIGWRKISEYDGGHVMQYDPDTGHGSFVQPTRFIVRPEEGFYYLKSKYGVNQMLSADHRILCWKSVGLKGKTIRTVLQARDFVNEHHRLAKGFKASFATTFVPDIDCKLNLSDDEIRVQVMVNADATLPKHGKAVAVFTRQRKIIRIRELLNNAHIPFTEIPGSRGTTVFRFQPPIWTKSYSVFWAASVSQLSIVADECLYWDGTSSKSNKDNKTRFNSIDSETADIIQYAFTVTGKRASIHSGYSGPDRKPYYAVVPTLRTMVSMVATRNTKSNIEVVPSLDGKSYCFQVPTGFWVMRREGNIVMTGNCGMNASLTNLTATDLPPSLDSLMSLIETRIPAGVGQGHDKYTQGIIQEIGYPRSELTSKQESTMWCQLGTLGSGNHYVEICLDKDNRVWATLHSGSRGIGNQLALKHIKLAKSFNQALEDRDLAYFIQGTPEFDAYIADMLWAQEYAFKNRGKMTKALLKSLFEVCGKGKVIDHISCHHNFTEQEEFDGQQLWITRKGAIKAYKGDRGLIPGSMGTASYIVSGKGVTDAWCSCSHGAGRRMSRAQAKRELTADSLQEAMKGRTWNGSVGTNKSKMAMALLDEHPDSYKSIDQVMADQEDLVTVDAVLTQILNYKGV